MKKMFFYIAMLLIVSCEKQTNKPILAEELDLLVVDATITDEHKAQTIRLTRTVTELNAKPQPVSGASVILSNPDQPPLSLKEQIDDPGAYKVPGFYNVNPGVEYTLLITADGKPYSAKTKMVKSGGPFQMLRYQKVNSGYLYRIVWVANPYDALHPAMFEILLDWSHVHGFTDLPPESCKARLYYYTLPTIDVSQIFAPELEVVKFPLGTKIVERKYFLNSEHAEFIRALISETNWKGGLFDSAPASVPTNLSEGAVGFFAACSVISDSLIVQ